MTDEQLFRRYRQLDPTLTYDERKRAAAYNPFDYHNRRYWTGYLDDDGVAALPRPIGVTIGWTILLAPFVFVALLIFALLG